MADFLDTAADLLRTNRAGRQKGAFERVFKAIGGLQSVHSKAQLDLNNIESVFTALELGRIIQKIPGMPVDEIPATIACLKELIVKTLEVTMEFPIAEREFRAPAPYENFANLIEYLQSEAFPKQSVSVISFNYDIGVDLALYRKGFGPNYVIEDGAALTSPVELLKLHGSLNWAADLNSRSIRPVHLHHYLKWLGPQLSGRASDQIAVGTKIKDYFEPGGVDVAAEPVIVPPSWNKADYHEALSNVWARAAHHIGEAESIFIIGYSLPETDSFFRHLYALGSVGSLPLRRLAVYNPDSTGDVDARFQRLLGPGARDRYSYMRATFVEALTYVHRLFPKRT